jgi:hypothetical protein
MRMRVAAVGATIALAIGGLAACSSSQDVVRTGAAGDAPSESAAAALERAGTKTVAVDTAKISVTVVANGMPGATGPATVTADGAIDNGTNRSQFSVDLSKLTGALPPSAGIAIGALGKGPLEVVTDGNDVYVKVGALGSLLGATSDKTWAKLSLADAPGPGAGGGTGAVADGTEILGVLGQAGEVTTVGNEAVRGVDTTHYRGTLDVATALDQLPADQRSQAATRLGQVGIDPEAVSVPVDVWIGQDDLVRRVQVGLDASQIKSGASAAGDLTATVTIELYDFGAPVDVTVPPADQVFTVDPKMLGSIGGFAGFHA